MIASTQHGLCLYKGRDEREALCRQSTHNTTQRERERGGGGGGGDSTHTNERL